VYLLIAYHFKRSIAPAHAIALAAPPDAVQNTAQFVHVQNNLLVAPDPSHPIHSCFKKYGYDTIHDLVAMTAEDVEALNYDIFDAAGALANTLKVPRGFKFMINAFILMFNNFSNQRSGILDCTSVLKDDFDDWRLLGYKPNVPLNHIHNVHGPLCTGPTPTESFECGIKKDKDQYPEFTNEKNWYNFCHDVEATAATHNTIEVLDFAYTPNHADADNVGLFTSKNRWMYSVLSAKLKTDTGMEIIQNHDLDCNAQIVWKELVDHHQNSQVGVYKKEELYRHLMNHKYDPNLWKGIISLFFINYNQKMREHYQSCNPGKIPSNYTKLTMLQAAISTIPTLNDIKNKCNISRTQGLPYLTLDAYDAIVKATAQIQDKETVEKSRSASCNVQVNVHDLQDLEFYDNYEQRETYYHLTQDNVEHNIDTSFQDIQAFRAQQTLGKKKFFNRMSIDRETWNTLDGQDKAAWDTLSTAAKAKILNGTLKRGEERALTRKPVSSTYSKPTAKTPTVNTQLANVNETHNSQEEEVHEAPPEDPSPNLGSFSHDTLDSKLLINLARSKLPPSYIQSILSQPTTKAKATQASRSQGQYNVGFHHVSDSEHIAQHNVSVFLQIFLGCLLFLSTLWSPKIGSTPPILHPTSKPTPYCISVSVLKSSHTGRALIDRGANGGIAGDDVCIISTTGRTVDVTGIDSHQLCSIKIGTVGAYADTQRGPAILIIHQYAIHQAHRTIHFCVQLEHFKNTVDDKSIKASGGQHLTTPDGYVIPIDILVDYHMSRCVHTPIPNTIRSLM
jgi:hypothetical protein